MHNENSHRKHKGRDGTMASPLEMTAPGILGNSDAQCQPEGAAVVSTHRCGLPCTVKPGKHPDANEV